MALERLKPSLPGAGPPLPPSPVAAQDAAGPPPAVDYGTDPGGPPPAQEVYEQTAQALQDAAPALADAVAAAIPQQQPQVIYGGGRRPAAPRRGGVAISRDPLDRFFPAANSKRLEVYRLVSETDGIEREYHSASFNGGDAAGFTSLAEFVRQRVANRTRRYGGYRCKAIDGAGGVVGTFDVFVDAPLDGPQQGQGQSAAPDGSGMSSPIYAAVADILRATTQGGSPGTGDIEARLRTLLTGQHGLDQTAIHREIADLRVQLAQRGSQAQDGPLGQALGLLLKRLDDADRFRNTVPQAPAVDVASVVERALAQQRDAFRTEITALEGRLRPPAAPVADPIEGMAAMVTAIGALLAATKHDPPPPPPPAPAQPDVVDTMVRFAKAREALEPRSEPPPDVLEQVQKVVAVAGALKTMSGGDGNGGNLVGMLAQLVKGGKDMIAEGKGALEKRVELEKAQADRAKATAVAYAMAQGRAGVVPGQLPAAQAATAAAAEQPPAPAPAAGGNGQGTPPPGLTDVLAAVADLGQATTDADRIRGTLKAALAVEGAMPEHKDRIRAVFARARAGDRAVLDELKAFLGDLVKDAGLAQAAADTTIAAFEKHWDTLVARGVFGKPAVAGTGVAPQQQEAAA